MLVFFGRDMDINLFQFFLLVFRLFCDSIAIDLLFSCYIRSSMTTIIAQINWKISVYHLCIEPFGDLIATFHKLKRTKRTHTYRHRSDVLCRLWRPRNWIFNYVYMAHRNQICVYETETNMFSAFVEIVINMRL